MNLLDKSKAFALEVIKLCNEVKNNRKESILTNQLVRSGTSVGANIREAFYAHGKADFISKLHITLKECAGSEYWLELLIEGNYTDNSLILEQCIEVKKILIASINTAKNNKLYNLYMGLHFRGVSLCKKPLLSDRQKRFFQ